MRLTLASIAGTVSLASAHLNILMTNDDGWAADNLHAGKAALERQRHKVLIIGPLENQSGSGGTVDLPTTNVTESGGIYGLVKPGSSYYGYLDDPSIRYFNSTPAGCALWGLKELSHARDFFNGEEPDVVVSGANNGPNLGPFVYSLSGTCGAAYAAVMAGTPAIAFSAYNSTHRPYYEIDQGNPFDPALLAGEMMANLVSALADGFDKDNKEGKQVLPKGIGLNVNFPYLNASCSTPPYILSRLNGGAYVDDFVLTDEGFPTWIDVIGSGIDTCHYGDCSLPGETEVVEGKCQSSISVFDVDYDASKQYAAPVQDHIRNYLAPVANRRMKRSMAAKLRKRAL